MLKEHPNRKIHAHHIVLKNKEGRDRAEQYSIQKLMPKLLKIRHFTYSESFRDDTRAIGFSFDMPIVCFEAGVQMKGLREHPDAGEVTAWTIGTTIEEAHNWKRWDIIKGAIAAGYWSPDYATPPPFELQPMVPKGQEMVYLKELNLLDDCWYCRTPTPHGVCNQCKTCEEVKLAMGEL
jgi:hypothetical protein